MINLYQSFNSLTFCPECYIWIKINVLGYTISEVLSQLAFRTSLDELVTKTDLSQKHLVVFF